jgi:polysaccharide transporter, PST family
MKSAFSNVSWLFVSQVGRIGTQLLGVAVIARLLTPSDFGVVAIALMVSNLAGLLRDMGTGPAAIRSRDASEKFLGAIYSVQVLISVLLAGLIMVMAVPLAHFYRIDSLPRILIIFAMVFPLAALGSVHLIVLERAQRYREISQIELMSYVAGLGAAVLLAKAGMGAESLAFQAVVNAAVQTILQRRAAGMRITLANPRHARSAAGGSMAVSSFNIMNYVVRNSDTAIAGRLAPPDFVGAYSMANRIALMPLQLIGMLVSRVSVPMLSRDELSQISLSRNAETLVSGTLLSSGTICLLLVSLRQFTTGVLFGPQWLEVVPKMLVWLLPAAALTSTTAVVVGVMIALGATSALTRTGVFTAGCHLASLVSFMYFDVKWLPSAILVSSVLGLTVAVVQLRAVQADQAISPVRWGVLIPAIPVLSYPLWHGVLTFLAPANSRPPSIEILEAVTTFLVLLLCSIPQLRDWTACWRQHSAKQGATG